MQQQRVAIVGGGLAGCEAAWQIARRGVKAVLHEMKPKRFSPAHNAHYLAELVCSNSFRAVSLGNAVGLLKEEMRLLETLFMEAATAARLPAGGALAVDRNRFSLFITKAVEAHTNIEVVRQEVTDIPRQRPLIIASGPLTSDLLAKAIQQLIGEQYLSFYDAISPVVEADSIDKSVAFRASRYGRGGDDYLNCPLNREQYHKFVTEVVNAQKAPLHDFEQAIFFEGCLPIEEMATRGKDTLVFGPMKPVGLSDPRTGKQPFAVVQLRPENAEGTIYSMVGFQTRMTWGEQKRIFRLIPGLGNVRFERLGTCHRNSFINAPMLLQSTLQLRKDKGIFFSGQITGVEGYVESTAMGMLAGINAARLVLDKPLIPPPPTTAIGSLVAHITKSASETFQPMNVNFGLFPALKVRVKKKKERRKMLSQRALEDLRAWREQLG